MEEDAESIMEALRSVVFMVQLMPVEEVTRLLIQAEHYDTFGPVLDPTTWRRTHRNVEEHAVLLRALLAFRREIDGVNAREAARAAVRP